MKIKRCFRTDCKSSTMLDTTRNLMFTISLCIISIHGIREVKETENLFLSFNTYVISSILNFQLNFTTIQQRLY